MIPLLTIQSVKGGKTANNELVITLIFANTGSSGKSESMVLLFSQQPGEQRKRERDDWLKTLMGLIVSVRQETSCDSITTAVPEIGIRPSMRRPNAPEIPHPYTKVVHTRPAPIELIIIPDEPEFPVFSEEKQELPDMTFPGEKTKSEVTPAPCAMKETPCASQVVSGSPDTLSPPIPVLEGTPVDSQVVSGSPDSLSPPIHVFEETPVDSQVVSGSPDILSPPIHYHLQFMFLKKRPSIYQRYKDRRIHYHLQFMFLRMRPSIHRWCQDHRIHYRLLKYR